MTDGAEAPRRRRYESPVRQQQVAETRERIVAAGAELVRGFTTWDWSDLTFRAVAERAGVGERTVYRHFPTERDLRDAIMSRLRAEAGVDYEALTLEDLPEVTGRILRSLGSYAVEATLALPRDPTFVAVDEQRRDALVAAVAEARPAWSAQDCRHVAAVLDVLWGIPSYERLVSAWGMDREEAIDLLGWAIEAVSAPGARPEGTR